MDNAPITQTDQAYEIEWIPCYPGYLAIDHYFMSIDDKGNKVEGRITGMTPSQAENVDPEYWVVIYAANGDGRHLQLSRCKEKEFKLARLRKKSAD